MRQLLKRGRTVVPLLMVVALILGCMGKVRKAAQRAQRSNQLKEIGLAYIGFLDTKGANKSAAPMKVEDLTSLSPDTITAVKNGDIVVIWGVSSADRRAADLGAGTSQTILAYEKDAPNNGGLVLFLDINVENLTAADFKAKAQAKPTGK
jgi:hypothetical protein